MRHVLWCLLTVLCLSVTRGQDHATLTVRSDSSVLRVYLDTLFLGNTPLDSAAIESGKHIIRFVNASSRNWYQSPVIETVKVNAGEHLVRNITLPASTYLPHEIPATWQPGAFHDSLEMISGKALEGKTVPSNTPLYLTTAGAVLGGIVAAYFKVQADNYYSDYENGDQSVRGKIKTRDTISGIALGVCEVNLVALTYLLLTR